MKILNFFKALPLLAIISLQAIAQQEDTTRTYELDQIVITGTRIEREKAKIPNSVTVVGEQEIEESGQINVLPVLSNKVPGLFLNERGIVGFGVGPRSGGGLSMRGLGSSGDPANTRVLVLVDGQPQFMGVFGHPIHDAYFSTNVEKVEVIRGPASILYGSNAMGGAINVITKKQQKDGYQIGAEVGYGSFNTQKYSLQGGLKEGKFNASIAFNHVFTDGHREDDNNEFSTTGGFASLGYRINNHFKLKLDGNVSDSYFFDPGVITDPAPRQNSKFEYLRGRLAFSIDNVYPSVEGSLRFFYNFGEHEFFDGFNSNDINQGFTFYQNFKPFAGNVFTLGVDYKEFGGEARNRMLSVDETIDETDFYLLIQQSLDKLNLNAGVRLVNNSVFGTEWIPQLGASYNASQSTTFKASASKGFRSPTLANLFFFPWSNPDLGPERMWNYEVSYLQSLMDGKASFEITGFIARGDNLILTRPTVSTINTGAFDHKGIEFAGAYHASDRFNLTMNYSYLSMETQLPYAPTHQLNLQADYMFENLRVQLGVKQVSDLLIGAVQAPIDRQAPLESYTLLHARASYSILDGLSVYAEGNNLLDQEYQIDRGYPLPGVNFMGGLKYRLHSYQ